MKNKIVSMIMGVVVGLGSVSVFGGPVYTYAEDTYGEANLVKIQSIDVDNMKYLVEIYDDDSLIVNAQSTIATDKSFDVISIAFPFNAYNITDRKKQTPSFSNWGTIEDFQDNKMIYTYSLTLSSSWGISKGEVATYMLNPNEGATNLQDIEICGVPIDFSDVTSPENTTNTAELEAKISELQATITGLEQEVINSEWRLKDKQTEIDALNLKFDSLEAADVNRDGKIDASDASDVLAIYSALMTGDTITSVSEFLYNRQKEEVVEPEESEGMDIGGSQSNYTTTFSKGNKTEEIGDTNSMVVD